MTNPSKQGLKLIKLSVVCYQGRRRNDKSIKTRIETNTGQFAQGNLGVEMTNPSKQGLKHEIRSYWFQGHKSKWQIHQNKDWNSSKTHDKNLTLLSKWQIHQNKDWNCLNFIVYKFRKMSKWQIHQNKDWNKKTGSCWVNLGDVEMTNPSKQGLKQVYAQDRFQCKKVEMTNPSKQGLKLVCPPYMPICTVVEMTNPSKQGLKQISLEPAKQSV